MAIASGNGYVLTVAHLYNAAHETNLLPEDVRWTDMEWVIEQQGSNWVFVGNKPTKSPDFYKHILLAGGIPLYQTTKEY